MYANATGRRTIRDGEFAKHGTSPSLRASRTGGVTYAWNMETVAEFPPQTLPPRIHLLGIAVDNVTLADAVELILQGLEDQRTRRACFVNADCVNLAFRDHAYRQVLQEADLVFADGSGMRLAGIVLGRRVRDNVNGTDLFPRLCKALAGRGKRIFLLGARPGIARRAAQWILDRFPGLAVAGYRDGYFSAEEESAVIEEIRHAQADVLLVAFGAPRQDIWIRDHLDRLGVKMALGVGGLFDFYSGRLPRAPRWIRKLGLEWAYRLYQEPRRLWKRYLIGNAAFLLRIFWARLRHD